jgi:hypothetical protein
MVRKNIVLIQKRKRKRKQSGGNSDISKQLKELQTSVNSIYIVSPTNKKKFDKAFDKVNKKDSLKDFKAKDNNTYDVYSMPSSAYNHFEKIHKTLFNVDLEKKDTNKDNWFDNEIQALALSTDTVYSEDKGKCYDSPPERKTYKIPTIQQVVNNMFTKETINDVECKNKVERVEAEKFLQQDLERGQNKINDFLFYIKRYDTKTVYDEENKKVETGIKNINRIQKKEILQIYGAKFYLAAVVCHLGQDANGGHYIAYVKRNNKGKNTWYYISDDSFENVKTLEDTETIDRIEENGYIFLYRKKQHLKSLPDVKGLKNLGNTCYMSSLMQLLNTTHLVNENTATFKNLRKYVQNVFSKGSEHYRNFLIDTPGLDVGIQIDSAEAMNLLFGYKKNNISLDIENNDKDHIFYRYPMIECIKKKCATGDEYGNIIQWQSLNLVLPLDSKDRVSRQLFMLNNPKTELFQTSSSSKSSKSSSLKVYVNIYKGSDPSTLMQNKEYWKKFSNLDNIMLTNGINKAGIHGMEGTNKAVTEIFNGDDTIFNKNTFKKIIFNSKDSHSKDPQKKYKTLFGKVCSTQNQIMSNAHSSINKLPAGSVWKNVVENGIKKYGKTFNGVYHINGIDWNSETDKQDKYLGEPEELSYHQYQALLEDFSKSLKSNTLVLSDVPGIRFGGHDEVKRGLLRAIEANKNKLLNKNIILAFDPTKNEFNNILSITTIKVGGKRRTRKSVRKHRGIIQTGGNTGRLRKGYKYTGRRLKNGKAEIVRVKRN